MVFTTRFIEDPCLCYGILCSIPNWDDINDFDIDDDDDIYSCNSRTLRKVPVLKGLLACAVLMLICNIIFIGTYLIVSIQLRAKKRSNIHTPDVMYQQQSTAVQWAEQPPYHLSNGTHPPHQHHPLYPMQTTQPTSPLPSAPPPYEMVAEKF